MFWDKKKIMRDTLLSVEPSRVWTDGTDNDVAMMCCLAYNGFIDLTKYWKVGDTRRVILNQGDASEYIQMQEIELVLMHAYPINYTYTFSENKKNERHRPWFIVGQKNCLLESAAMFATSIDELAYKQADLQAWLHNVYLFALPSELMKIFKYVKIEAPVVPSLQSKKFEQTSGLYNDIIHTNVFLPSIGEIMGGEEDDELYKDVIVNKHEITTYTQFSYYKDHPVIKTAGNSDEPKVYWTRSVHCDNKIQTFCAVNREGKVMRGDILVELGIAPCMCI